MIVNIVLAQEPASRFSQEVSTGERKLSEGKMLNAVELASGVEIFLCWYADWFMYSSRL